MRLKLKCAFKEGPSNTAKRIFFVVGGRGGTPNPVQKNSTKKTGNSVPKITDLFGQFYGENFRRLSVIGGWGRGEGGTPN